MPLTLEKVSSFMKKVIDKIGKMSKYSKNSYRVLNKLTEIGKALTDKDFPLGKWDEITKILDQMFFWNITKEWSGYQVTDRLKKLLKKISSEL